MSLKRQKMIRPDDRGWDRARGLSQHEGYNYGKSQGLDFRGTKLGLDRGDQRFFEGCDKPRVFLPTSVIFLGVVGLLINATCIFK